MKLTLVTLSLMPKVGDLPEIVMSEMPALPRTDDRMFVYDLFKERYPDSDLFGLTKTTPLIVSSVDWIFTGTRYRIDVKLAFPPVDAHEIFKSTFGVDLSSPEKLSPTQPETVADKSPQ